MKEEGENEEIWRRDGGKVEGKEQQEVRERSGWERRENEVWRRDGGRQRAAGGYGKEVEGKDGKNEELWRRDGGRKRAAGS